MSFKLSSHVHIVTPWVLFLFLLPTVQHSVLKALKKALMAELWHTVQQGEAGVGTCLHVEVLSSLIRLAAVNSDLIQPMKELPAILQKPDTYER